MGLGANGHRPLRRALCPLEAKRRPPKRVRRGSPASPSPEGPECGTVGGVSEDHSHEQFFWDDATVDRLWAVARRYRKPLFLCCPSLAYRAEQERHDYVLLDRDTRFKFLNGLPLPLSAFF